MTSEKDGDKVVTDEWSGNGDYRKRFALDDGFDSYEIGADGFSPLSVVLGIAVAAAAARGSRREGSDSSRISGSSNRNTGASSKS